MRLELEIEGERIARFPIWAWNEVYCGGYLGSRKEERDFYHRLRQEHPDFRELWPLPEPWGSELEASWERLFTRKLPRRRRGFDGCWVDNYEAVLEQIRLADVQAITEIVGSNKVPADLLTPRDTSSDRLARTH